jgi:phenylacetate-CoA ligase
MPVIWDEKNECMPVSELRKLQLERLKDTVKRVWESVPLYQQKLREASLTPQSIRSLDDLQRLPFTVKDDLRAAYPFGMFARPLKEIVRIHASSGTTGQVTVVGYTRNDISTWAELMARTLACADTGSEDVVHNAYGYGLFTGGLGIHYGAERIGASVIPMSGGNTKRQIMVMVDFGSTVLTCTPSYALYMAEVAEEMGVDFKSLKLKSGAFGAEPWSDSMRREIEEKLNLSAIDIYGLSEVMGPGVASECQEKTGLHICEDHFIAEVIDPSTLQPVPPGEIGELVFTTISKEGIPLIRYRTRDITRFYIGDCPCGRTHVRMARVTGRSDDMLIIRGVNVFPSQIESILMEIEGTEPHYQLVIDRKGKLDEVEVQVEVSPQMFTDEVKGLEELQEKVCEEIQSSLGIGVSVKLVEPKTIQRSEGKAKRVIDKREL